MELVAVPAAQFSGVQLTGTLNACFEAYLMPATQSVAELVQRLSAERMGLIGSRVWLAGDGPVAITIVARRGGTAHLATLALCPAWRGEGLGQELIQDLLTLLRQQGVGMVSLEVIHDSHAAVVLYQTLDSIRRYGLCDYLSSEPLAPVADVLQLYPTLVLPRRTIDESSSQLP